MIVPHPVNCLLCYNRSNNSGLPVGVSRHECGKYVVESSYMGKQKKLGYYDILVKTGEVYKTYRTKFTRDIVSRYEGKIPAVAFDALMNWEI